MKSIMLFVFIFLGMFSIIIIGIFVFAGNLVNESFSLIDLEVSGQNFTEVYDDTLGQGINGFINSADNFGLGLLFGMIMLMILVAFLCSDKKKWFFVIDFLILIMVFMVAVALQITYDLAINSSEELLDVYSNDLSKSSTFILNLPFIVPIVWLFIVVLSYSNITKPRRDQTGGVGF